MLCSAWTSWLLYLLYKLPVAAWRWTLVSRILLLYTFNCVYVCIYLHLLQYISTYLTALVHFNCGCIQISGLYFEKTWAEVTPQRVSRGWYLFLSSRPSGRRHTRSSQNLQDFYFVSADTFSRPSDMLPRSLRGGTRGLR